MHEASGGPARNWRKITPTVVYWPKQVTGLALIQGVGKTGLLLFMEEAVKDVDI